MMLLEEVSSLFLILTNLNFPFIDGLLSKRYIVLSRLIKLLSEHCNLLLKRSVTPNTTRLIFSMESSVPIVDPALRR